MYGSKYTCGKQYDPRFRPWFLTVRQRKPYEAVCVSVRARVRADGSAYAKWRRRRPSASPGVVCGHSCRQQGIVACLSPGTHSCRQERIPVDAVDSMFDTRACHVHAYVCAYMGTLLHTLRVIGLAPVGHAASDRRPGA